VFCGGDIAGYGEELDETVALLAESGCRSIRGNHDEWYLEQAGDEANRDTQRYLSNLPLAVSLSLEGMRVYMVHASPPIATMGGIRLLDEAGELLPEQVAQWSETLVDFGYDVLLVGHTHQVIAEQLGRTLVINPGSTLFNHSCAVLTLPELDLQWFGLGDFEPVTTWNWGANRIYAGR
jgi:predicted phosphodiesterase